MKIYRVINKPYQDPRGLKDEKESLLGLEETVKAEATDDSFASLLKSWEQKGADNLARLSELKIMKRLGHFSTNKDYIIKKHGAPKGSLLVVDAPEEELQKYLHVDLVGSDFKYGVVYNLPDDAPYEPKVIPLSRFLSN